MIRRFVPLVLGALAALPGPAVAQSFGTQLGPQAADAPHPADPVTVEVQRDGHLFWLGRLQPGLGYAGERMELAAQPRGLSHCFDSTGTVPTGTRSLDRLAVSVRRSPAPFLPDRYAFRLDWRAVTPLASPVQHPWPACGEKGQRADEIHFDAEVRLPPGERVRVDAASGFEIFLTRPAGAPAETLATGRQATPRPIQADFDAAVERTGETLWQGPLHQETSADEPKVEVERFIPRPIACSDWAEGRRCVDQTSDRWTLKIRAIDPEHVSIEFSADRTEPDYQVRYHHPGYVTYPTDREERFRNAARSIVALARGGTMQIRAGDYVIRVGRR
jgi:hypothetical protein